MKSPSSSAQLVAIVGGSGAGKTWLTQRLGEILGEQAGALSLDNFYRDRSHLSLARRNRLNFDTPSAIDWLQAERTLRDCQAGRTTVVPRYDFATHRRLPGSTPWRPHRLVLVEGLSLLVRPSVRNLFALKIYLDCPSQLRLRRRIARDIAERGRSAEAVLSQFRATVAPMHERHVEPQQRWADLVLTQPYRKKDLLTLGDHLWALLTASAPLRPWLRVPFHHQLLNRLTCHECQA